MNYVDASGHIQIDILEVQCFFFSILRLILASLVQALRVCNCETGQ